MLVAVRPAGELGDMAVCSRWQGWQRLQAFLREKVTDWLSVHMKVSRGVFQGPELGPDAERGSPKMEIKIVLMAPGFSFSLPPVFFLFSLVA